MKIEPVVQVLKKTFQIFYKAIIASIPFVLKALSSLLSFLKWSKDKISIFYNNKNFLSALDGEYDFYKILLIWCVIPLLIFVGLQKFASPFLYMAGLKGFGFLLIYLIYSVTYFPASMVMLVNSRNNIKGKNHSRAIIFIYLLSVTATLAFHILIGLQKYKLKLTLFSQYDISLFSLATCSIVIFISALIAFLSIRKKFPYRQYKSVTNDEYNKPIKLTEPEIAKKQRTLALYKSTKEKGPFINAIKTSLGLAAGVSFINWYNSGLFQLFIISFILTFVLYFCVSLLTWSNIDKKIEILTQEIKTKIKNKNVLKARAEHYVAFVIIIFIMFSPIIFKEKFAEWDKHNVKHANKKTIEKFNDQYSMEPTNIDVEFFGGKEKELSIPKSYLFLEKTTKTEGVFARYFKYQTYLSAQLLNLEPWKLTEETIEKIQLRYRRKNNQKEKISPTEYDYIKADANYIGIAILNEEEPLNEQKALETLKKSTYYKDTSPVDENKYGLNIYNVQVSVPFKLKKYKNAFTPISGQVAMPSEKDKYPPMLIACESVCTLVSNYEDKFMMIITFHAAHLNDWQQIWKKVNSKLESFIK